MPDNTSTYSKYFVIKVWLTTIVLSPILLLFIIADAPAGLAYIPEMLAIVFYSIFFGALLSLPALLIYDLSFQQLKTTSLETGYIKIILVLITAICIFITFFVMNGPSDFSFDGDFAKIESIYIGVNIVASLFFKLKIPLKEL
jgi:hypothetical protein